MDWLEITVETNTASSDIVSEALIAQGAAGTQIIDRADVPDPAKPHGYWELIDASLIDAMPQNVHVKAWFQDSDDLNARVTALREHLASLPALCGMDMGSLNMSFSGAKDDDWAEVWKKYYKPFRAGKSLVIKPSWEPYAPLEGDKVIELDPGMAFGTGMHDTTAMCIALMESCYRGGRVLDVGTGSGVLAIAAAKLGAQEVTAVDIDPMAVRVATENVEKNGLSQCVTVKRGDLLSGLDVTCDLAVANILADVIILLARPLIAHLNEGGIFICSGIIKQREDDVVRALAMAGYDLFVRRQRGEWLAFAARKRKTSKESN